MKESTTPILIKCGSISATYSADTDGGAVMFTDDLINVIKDLYPGRKFRQCWEWCSGPGIIGYTILGNNLCDTLYLSDIYQPALDEATVTAELNIITYIVKIVNSHNLTNIPEHEQFDLIVANPPWFSAVVYMLQHVMYGNERRYVDTDWQAHRDFFNNVGRNLSPDGSIILQECAWGSSIETFNDMIDNAGLRIKRHFRSQYKHPHVGKILYYIEIIHK